MRVVAFLPVKGTSERIQSKNTTPLDGKKLFLHTLEKLMVCDFIDEVFLDTESDEIYESAKYTGCTYLKRDVQYASNATDGHMLFAQAAEKVDADIYIQILCTSPFISIETIKAGVEILKHESDVDSVVCVKKEKQYCWNVSETEPLYDRENIPNSKDLPDTIIETMGLYMTNRDVALNQRRRYGKKVKLLPVSSVEAFDINYPDDFVVAELIAKGMNQKEIMRLNFVKKFVNSAMLSDVLDDLNISGVISSLRCNFENGKIWGRAKTLKIRELQENEDYTGIYDALQSYQFVTNNDVIMVENECSSLAYFGELNATLAIQSGASATIIGGVTRDSANVKNLDYPVFSKGYNCKDVRKRATTESMNQEICIENVKISPNDLIFGDDDGVVVIPARQVERVLNVLFEKIQMEKNVLQGLFDMKNPLDIVQTVGEF